MAEEKKDEILTYLENFLKEKEKEWTSQIKLIFNEKLNNTTGQEKEEFKKIMKQLVN